MKCGNCQEFIDDDSKFCQFCGQKVIQSSPSDEKLNKFWQKFVGYSYEKEEAKRAQNRLLIPENIIEIIKRFSTNIFEALKENNDEIQKLPFSVVENIRSYYYLSCEDGYWLYVTNKEFKNEKPATNKAKVEEIVEELQETLKDETKFKRYLTEDFIKVFQANESVEFDVFIQNNPQIKELSAKTVDNIKTDLQNTTLWTYICCEIAETL